MDRTVHIISRIWVIYGTWDPGWWVRGAEPPGKKNYFFAATVRGIKDIRLYAQD